MNIKELSDDELNELISDNETQRRILNSQVVSSYTKSMAQRMADDIATKLFDEKVDEYKNTFESRYDQNIKDILGLEKGDKKTHENVKDILKEYKSLKESIDSKSDSKEKEMLQDQFKTRIDELNSKKDEEMSHYKSEISKLNTELSKQRIDGFISGLGIKDDVHKELMTYKANDLMSKSINKDGELILVDEKGEPIRDSAYNYIKTTDAIKAEYEKINPKTKGGGAKSTVDYDKKKSPESGSGITLQLSEISSLKDFIDSVSQQLPKGVTPTSKEGVALTQKAFDEHKIAEHLKITK